MNSIRHLLLKMFKEFTIIALLIASASCANIPNASPKHGIKTDPTLEALLDSLLRLMNFFAERYDKVNVDGLFGIRAVEGEMLRALELADSGVYTRMRNEPHIRSKVKEILHVAQEAAQKALPEVKKKGEKYYRNFFYIIGKPWRMYQVQPQRISKMKEKDLPDTSEETKEEGQTDDFDETKSDICMGTLLGNDHEKCDVNTCWDVMSKPGTKLYYTTHQILWFQLGLQAGCQREFEEKAPDVGGIDKIFRRLCGNVIFQMEAMFRHGTVDAPYQDIFAEKGMICGGMGFVDAVNLTWLQEVMRWQHKKLGCFREVDPNGVDDLDAGSYNKWLKSKKIDWKSRKLLEDFDMGDRCSAHKSAVAAGFLAIHTRLFLDPEYQRVKQLLATQPLHSDIIIEDITRVQYFLLGFFITGFIVTGIGPRRRSQLLRMLCCKTLHLSRS